MSGFGRTARRHWLVMVLIAMLAVASPFVFESMRLRRQIAALTGIPDLGPDEVAQLRRDPHLERILSLLLASDDEVHRRVGLRILSAGLGDWAAHRQAVFHALEDSSWTVRDGALRATAARYYLGDAELDASWVERYLTDVLLDRRTRLWATWLMNSIQTHREAPWVLGYMGRDFDPRENPERLWSAFAGSTAADELPVADWSYHRRMFVQWMLRKEQRYVLGTAMIALDDPDDDVAREAVECIFGIMASTGVVSGDEYRDRRLRLQRREVVQARLPTLVEGARGGGYPLPPTRVVEALLGRFSEVEVR